MKFAECFDGVRRDHGDWQFQLSESVNGAFGGTNGGVLAALAVHVARDLAVDRRVTAVDARFIRAFRPGQARPGSARVVGTVVNAGRTLSTIQVDVCNAEGKLCTRALVSLVNSRTLADLDGDGSQPPTDLLAPAAGTPWARPKPPMQIPLL